MNLYKFSHMKLGYFVGAFAPTAYYTKDAEVALKVHRAGEYWPKHYQETATEVNLLLLGEMAVNGITLKADVPLCVKCREQLLTHTEKPIFVIEPKEAVKPIFHTDCALIVFKSPSNPTDKIVIPEYE